MTAHEVGRDAGGGTISDDRREPLDRLAETADTAFLKDVIWALDGLRRHAARRGHGPLAEALATACGVARDELKRKQPRPAEIASGRMKALWRHEGRG